MKISGLGVFDFSEEDELPDVAAGKFLKKFKNPNSEDVAILKYKFLERVAQGTSVKRDIARNTLCVDEDAVDCDKKLGNGISSSPLCTTRDDFAKSAKNPRLDAATQSSSTSRGQQEIKLDNQGSQSPFAKPEARVSSLQSSPPRKCLINAHLDSPLRVEPVDICADADESSTSSLSDIAEDGVSLNGRASDHCFGDLEMYQRNMAVTLQPDYVMYRDTYCTESLVTFSQSCIRAVGHDNKETFNIEWGIDEIVDIKCQRFHEVDIISVKLHVVSKDAVQTDNAHGTAGVEELKFAVVEPNWAEKRAQITCLNDKYLAIGDVLVDEDMDGDDLPGRSYFPSFDEPFEEVVYPKGDVDAVSISKRDVDLLQPETFINDTIIDFYIKYLENQLQSEERTRFHFFNSFFFRKLADLDKDPSSASDGRAAFLRVRKWTRKVDLFKKDYIFIPVNFNLHWSLIVICHLGEVASFKDEDLDQLHEVPCILHMDSIKGSHSGLKNLVQSYLWEEWKERQMEISEQISSKFLNLRFVELELPQQENSFDCGLFLLHYLELFLGEAPVRFSLFQINKFSAFLNVDWFPPVEASLKRALIQKLIFELLENRSCEISSPACSDEHLSYKFPESKGKETCVEFISERCSAGVSGHQNLLGGQEGEGVEITLLAASSVRGSQCVYNSGPVLRDLLESGAAEGSSFGQYQSYRGSSFCHQNGGLSPLEEDGETGKDFILMASEKAGFGKGWSISQASKGLKAGTARDPAISVLATHEDVVSSPETSDWESDDDIGIIEHFPTGKGTVPSQEEEKDKQNCLLVENTGDAMDSLSPSRVIENTFVIEGSKDLNNEDNDRGHLHAKDSTFIHMVETTAECSIEPSRDLNNVHANDGDQVLPKDPASEIANTPTAEGCQLDKFLLKDGQYLPSEDPACSGMVKISTDTIFTNKGDGDPHAPSSLLNSDLVGSELEHEHTMSENGNVLGDDVAESRRQHSVKRRYVPEGQGEQAVKKMQSASFVNRGVVDG